MGLLKLPNEIIQTLLVHCIVARGVKRGVRLRLVCKLFDDTFTLALYRSHLLDDFFAPQVGFRWWLRYDQHGHARLWHDYLVYRVKGETDPEVGRYLEIRHAAKKFHDLAVRGDGDPSIEHTIDGLCWLALERGTDRPGDRERWEGHGQDYWQLPALLSRRGHLSPKESEGLSPASEETPFSPDQGALCAAAYFNEVSIAAHLLKENEGIFHPADQRGPFPSPVEIAAFRGHRAILDLFQRHILSKEPQDFSDDDSYIKWALENTSDAIQGAAINGNIELLISVLFPPSQRLQQPNISEPLDLRLDHNICGRMRVFQNYSRTPAMYDYFTTNFPLPSPVNAKYRLHRLNKHRAHYAQHGSVIMLRHLVGTSIGFPNGNGRKGDILAQACRGCFEDVVDFLLERKAKLTAMALEAAIKGGSVKIVQKLFHAGVKMSMGNGPANFLARIIIRAENKLMFELIRENGYELTKERQQELTKDALAYGLESMAELLNAIDCERR